METFVVRIWVPAEVADAIPADLNGVVEHVGSGQWRCRRFASSTELLTFIDDMRSADAHARDDSKKGNSDDA
jgi:hypothetical protein